MSLPTNRPAFSGIPPANTTLKDESPCPATAAPKCRAPRIFFFTVNLLNRRSDLLVRHIDLLRETVRATRSRHPFHIDAWVVLPDHMHCVWTLPDGDADFALRWKVIKFAFARRLPKTEVLTATQRPRGERGIWQRRYWEHMIRDERDYRHHVDYVHRNPLKHGLVERLVDWPYSSFHRAIGAGVYPVNWCGDEMVEFAGDWD